MQFCINIKYNKATITWTFLLVWQCRKRSLTVNCMFSLSMFFTCFYIKFWFSNSYSHEIFYLLTTISITCSPTENSVAFWTSITLGMRLYQCKARSATWSTSSDMRILPNTYSHISIKRSKDLMNLNFLIRWFILLLLRQFHNPK